MPTGKVCCPEHSRHVHLRISKISVLKSSGSGFRRVQRGLDRRSVRSHRRLDLIVDRHRLSLPFPVYLLAPCRAFRQVCAYSAKILAPSPQRRTEMSKRPAPAPSAQQRVEHPVPCLTRRSPSSPTAALFPSTSTHLATTLQTIRIRTVSTYLSFFSITPFRCVVASGCDFPLLCLLEIPNAVCGRHRRVSLVVAVIGPSPAEPSIFLLTMSVAGHRHREQEYGCLSYHHRIVLGLEEVDS
jgi:hypothetical protein